MPNVPSDGFQHLQGEVVVNHRVDSKTYSSIHALVHGMFPHTTSTEQVFFLHFFFSLLNSRLVLLQVFCSKIRHYVRDQNCFQWSIFFIPFLFMFRNWYWTTGLYINISVPRSSSLSICIC